MDSMYIVNLHRWNTKFTLAIGLVLLLLALPRTAACLSDEPGTASLAAAPTASSTSTTSTASSNLWRQKYMFNWGPGREALADKGVTFDFFYVIDALGDMQAPDGARKEFNGWGRLRGTVDVDFSKFSSAKGLTYHATGLWQYGQNMGALIGSISNPSGLVSIHTFRLDSMWFQQALFGNKLFLKAGQFAGMDFYGNQVYGSNFIIDPLDYAFGNMGNVRQSWDPSSGPAGEIKVVPTKYFYIKSGVYSPRNYSVTGFNYHKTDNNFPDSSATSDSEIGIYTDPSATDTRKNYNGLIKIGGVYNGGKFFDYSKNGYTTGNYTIYVQGAQPVYRMMPASDRGLDITAGVNTGPASLSEVPTEITFGATWNGPSTSRSHDKVSFGLVYSKISSQYNTSTKSNLSDETALEFNYKFQATPWMVIQPVFQHYVSVGGTQQAATLGGLRFQVSF